LDVASEMAAYTAKQIAVQAGISMLTQANTTQRNLIRLLDGGGF
jgi:flagellin